MSAKPKDMSKAYSALSGVIREDYKGDLLSFDESLDRTIRQMEMELAEIEEGEWNGVKIRNPAMVGEYMQSSLGRVMEASTAVMNCVGTTGWRSDLDIPYEERDRLGGTTSVDLLEAGEKLTGAVNHWLTFAARHPEYHPGLPLAANHPARDAPGEGISRLSEVTLLGVGGYEALPFLTNENIAQLRREDTAPASRPAPVAMSIKP